MVYTEGKECAGLVLDLELEAARLVLIKGSQRSIKKDFTLHRTFTGVKTTAGFGVLGLTINPLGIILNDLYSMDDATFLSDLIFIEIWNNSPGIIYRKQITFPVLTGIAAIDCFIPIGCGQRELIIGDNNTGKTSLAITMVISQKHIINVADYVWRTFESFFFHTTRLQRLVPCIYVFIGKRRSELVRIQNVLSTQGALHYTCLLFSGSDELASLQYLAAYSGCAIGEWFRDQGYHPIVIYDDLSEHAVAYRQIALLLRRPPGREAYPGDVFFVHSKLLERSAQLSKQCGGGSLTSFPIIETKGGDISSYIPTNVISITDGQIFLSKSMVNKGLRPAVDLGLSVSRVGSKAQLKCVKYVTKKIKRDYALYKAYEGLSKVSSDLDITLAGYVKRGVAIISFLKQSLYSTYNLYQMVIGFFLLSEGFLDNINLKNITLYFELFFNGIFVAMYLQSNMELVFFATTELVVSYDSLFKVFKMNTFFKQLQLLGSLYESFYLQTIEPLIKSALYGIAVNSL